MNKTSKNNCQNSEDYLELVRRRITDLLNQNDISNRLLSKSIGMSDNYIQKTLTGAMTPSLDKIFLICDFFDIAPRDFFDFEKPVTDAQLILDTSTRQLSEHDKLRFARMITAYMSAEENPISEKSGGKH